MGNSAEWGEKDCMGIRIWEMKGPGVLDFCGDCTAHEQGKDHGAVQTGRRHSSQVCGGAWSRSSPVCRSRDPDFTAPPQGHFPDLISLLSCLRWVLHS